jgi:hypothetical protein
VIYQSGWFSDSQTEIRAAPLLSSRFKIISISKYFVQR